MQLSPHFSPRQLPALQAYLDALPDAFPYAVEVRHPDFFKEPIEQTLQQMLADRQVDRVIFDSRPLYALPPRDEFEQRSQQRKPRVPVRKVTTGRFPLVRLIGRNDVEAVARWIDEWAGQVADWIASGLTPYLFTHTPDDRWAPQMARDFNNAVASRIESIPRQEFRYQQPEQLRLF